MTNFTHFFTYSIRNVSFIPNWAHRSMFSTQTPKWRTYGPLSMLPVSNFRNAWCDSIVMGRQDYHWKYEPILYGWKEGAAHTWYSDRKQSTFLEFDKSLRNAEHPTMKPLNIIYYLIKNSSKQRDIVGDGFLGSGSTLIACEMT